jgi:hypothetical protein
MAIASAISILAFYHAFGNTLAAYSPFLALAIAMVLSPVFAVATKGKYYIAREPSIDAGEQSSTDLLCVMCEQAYEAPDMARCPFHSGPICSLCCTLEKSCHDMCKGSVRDAVPNVAMKAPMEVSSPAPG